MLCGLANQGVDGFDLVCKVLMVRNPATPVGSSRRFSVVVVNVYEVNVTGNVQLARTEFSHAHNPELGTP